MSCVLRLGQTAIVLTALAGSANPAEPCKETLGAAKSQDLVSQCLDVSPATHPPCNASNPCDLIIGEIKRGCGMLGSDAPAYCKTY